MRNICGGYLSKFYSCFFYFIPHPAEYGAEEFVLDAVPTLGLVRIGLEMGGGESSGVVPPFETQIDPVERANGVAVWHIGRTFRLRRTGNAESAQPGIKTKIKNSKRKTNKTKKLKTKN